MPPDGILTQRDVERVFHEKQWGIYLLTAIGLPPDGSSTVHSYTQKIHRTTQKFWKSAGRAPSWLVIPWHLPYN